MRRSRWLSMVWLSAVVAFGLAACGDTWEGLKKDTGENLEAVGSTVQGAGKEVKEDAE